MNLTVIEVDQYSTNGEPYTIIMVPTGEPGKWICKDPWDLQVKVPEEEITKT
ncbi:MAG: hypothetical protein ACW987_00625 [Candidatus Thorarchaeota archaeon]|jgi:hypothetical protein